MSNTDCDLSHLYIVKCGNDCEESKVYCASLIDVNNKQYWEGSRCQCCGSALIFVNGNEISKASDLIEHINSELESDNYHSLTGLATEIFNAFPEIEELERAKRIYNIMHRI